MQEQKEMYLFIVQQEFHEYLIIYLVCYISDRTNKINGLLSNQLRLLGKREVQFVQIWVLKCNWNNMKRLSAKEMVGPNQLLWEYMTQLGIRIVTHSIIYLTKK